MAGPEESDENMEETNQQETNQTNQQDETLRRSTRGSHVSERMQAYREQTGKSYNRMREQETNQQETNQQDTVTNQQDTDMAQVVAELLAGADPAATKEQRRRFGQLLKKHHDYFQGLFLRWSRSNNIDDDDEL